VAASSLRHGKADDLVEVLVEQERWLARRDSRTAHGRAELARLIDYSLLDEVLAETPPAAAAAN
jgi:hypothetical protein